MEDPAFFPIKPYVILLMSRVHDDINLLERLSCIAQTNCIKTNV